jgi:hypothetical protein
VINIYRTHEQSDTTECNGSDQCPSPGASGCGVAYCRQSVLVMLSVCLISFTILSFSALIACLFVRNARSLRLTHENKTGCGKSGDLSGHRFLEISRSSRISGWLPWIILTCGLVPRLAGSNLAWVPSSHSLQQTVRKICRYSVVSTFPSRQMGLRSCDQIWPTKYPLFPNSVVIILSRQDYWQTMC